MEIMIKVDINGTKPIEFADILVSSLSNISRIDKAFVVHRDSYND